MVGRTRWGKGAAGLLIAAALVGPAVLGAAPLAASPSATVSTTDAAGDTVSDPADDPITAPRADIVATSADAQPTGITLAFRVAQPVDPKADSNWADGESEANWLLDVDGDGARDFGIDYSLDEETGSLSASLRHYRGNQPPDACDPKATFDPTTGFAVTVDPKCLGGATAFRYQVEIEYLTDATNDDADVAGDASPDDGWAGPVSVTLAAGVEPLTLPTVPTQAAPSRPSLDPEATSPGGTSPATPMPSAPKTATTTPRRAPAAPLARPTPAGSATTSASPRPAAPPEAAPDLAHTGLSDRAVRLAAFAVGVALMGIGLRFANRRPQPLR